MISKSIDEYVFFGTAVRYLQDIQPEFNIFGQDRVLGNIDHFLQYLTKLGLHVTERVSLDLRVFADDLRKLPDDSVMSQDQAATLRSLMGRIRETLFAELAGVEAFVTTPKRIDLVKLINDVSLLFAPGVYAKLPEIARFDLAEAGKCIAFERSTAAAFHLMRATESVLRSFYDTLVKQKRTTHMWGPMVIDLRKRPKAKQYDTLLNHLDNIRNSFRNPTQHPEKIYDIQEVQDLWGLCVDAINRMSQILK